MCARSIKTADSSLQTQRKIQKHHLASLLKARKKRAEFSSIFVKNQAVANYRIKSKKGKYDEAEHHLIGIGGNVNR